MTEEYSTTEQLNNTKEEDSIRFFFTHHGTYEDIDPITDKLYQEIQGADIVFVETLGWSPAEQELYNEVSNGSVDAFRFALKSVRNKRGKNSFGEARIRAIRDSGKPIFIADADSYSKPKRDRNAYLATGLVLKPSLSASLTVVRNELETMASGIDERHETAVSIINAEFGASSDYRYALVVYGGAHTGLERMLKSEGYQTSHCFTPELPVIFDYKSEILRKLEFGISVERSDYVKALAQNIVESTCALFYPIDPAVMGFAQRAVADSLSEVDVAILNRAGNRDRATLDETILPYASRLQQVIDSAVVKLKPIK